MVNKRYVLQKALTVPRTYNGGVVTVFDNNIRHIKFGQYCSISEHSHGAPFNPNNFEIIEGKNDSGVDYLVIGDKTNCKKTNTVEDFFWSWFNNIGR